MLNPESNNFKLDFGNDLFPDFLTEKYDEYLFTANKPIKNIKNHIHESIQGFTLPGLEIPVNEINGLKNFSNSEALGQKTENYVFQKNQPIIEMYQLNRVNVIMKNTIINWIYFYEAFRAYAERGKVRNRLNEFTINVLVRDASDTPIVYFNFKNCFFATLPTLDFTQNATFNETKTIDVGFWFNQLDVKFIIPKFNVK